MIKIIVEQNDQNGKWEYSIYNGTIEDACLITKGGWWSSPLEAFTVGATSCTHLIERSTIAIANDILARAKGAAK